MPDGFNGLSLSRICLVLIPVTLLFSQQANAWVLVIYTAGVSFQPDLKKRLLRASGQPWIYPPALLYLVFALSLFWTEDLASGWFMLEKKASLLALPLALVLDSHFSRYSARLAMGAFIMACATALLYCMSVACLRYWWYGLAGFFFYHQLGFPLDLNAIYFSLFVLTSLIFLFYFHFYSFNGSFWGDRLKFLLILAVHVAGLILLASKLFLFLLPVFLLAYFSSGMPSGSRRLLPAAAGAALLILAVVFWLEVPRQRFESLANSRFELLTRDQLSEDTPLNGLTLRLLLLRFGGEILREEGAIVKGAGAGDGRTHLNNRILSYHLYTGSGEGGYWNYNFHNQYMELWVQAGLPALGCFLAALILALSSGFRRGWSCPMIYLFLCLLALGFTESYLERQRGLVFFAYFYSLFQSMATYEEP